MTDGHLGEPVCVPLRLVALVARGQILLANGRETVLDEAPVDYGIDASERLAEIREGDR
jgi:hypothetical protein